MKPSRFLPALAVVPLLAACGPKLVREPVFTSENGGVSVERRRMVEGDQPVARGWKHPSVISDVRLAHILAQLLYEDPDGAKQPLVRSEHVYDLAAGMVKAFAAAGPDDEVVARLLSIERRMGIFTVEKVTALRAHFEPDFLVLELFAVERAIDRGSRTYSESDYQAPASLPDTKLSVKLVAGESISLRGPRGYQVAWRDAVFARPISLSLRGGKLRRRTILMEAEPEELAPELPESDLTPEQREAQLRALDALDAERRAGGVTEAEFQRRRRLILEGRLEDAGYGRQP